ncbi:putative Nucleoporin Nup159/Nup146 N-terminal domain-containing protein [Seiridium unicorne]|uniref:Nucleoporin Nup159/Nup146 N-terminal domain-containing protein n=1 Tax=Seiridium unicorne TaxID=138068 RepID=A0ABR2UUM0_9PEZI
MAFNQGQDLQLIQTERLGFLSLAGEAKLRLTSQWSPAPVPNASLISIAHHKGLVAAAGPDAISLATTEAVRKAFEAPKDGDSDVRPFNPQLKIPLPTRISHLAFTADENYLIISAEVGGGLAVYDVQALLGGSTQSSFQIPTNGEALRALVPNPQAAKGELVAVVTEKGNLLMANMKEKNFVPGPNGQILASQVSCAAWSTKGKQIVAGLGDGSIHQMTPEGEVKAQIPRPPGVEGNFFVSFLLWLENDLFLAIYVSTGVDPPQSIYQLITRQGQNFASQRLTDPVDPFGSDKVPHHTAARLKDFPPNLQDLLIFSSSASPDIGLLTRAKSPLSDDNVTNVFTTTELLDDSKRATMPMNDSMETPLPIGTAVDLSGKDPVYKPIPTDEMEQSPGPLPGYWVLNDEGVLSVWWVIYTESVRGGTTYPGMAVVEGNAMQSAPAPQASQAVNPNPFAAPSASAFGTPAGTSSSAFGSTSAIGSKPSPWGSQPPSGGSSAFGSGAFGSAGATPAAKFGQPSFGQPSFGQTSTPSFGQSAGLGPKTSPWATAATNSPAGSMFASAAKGPSAFGSAGGATSGGFASFANQGGFSALGSNEKNSSASIFASGKPAADESMDADSGTAFPVQSSKPASNTANPFGSTPFKLTSSFKPNPSASDDQPAMNESSEGKSLFGSGFASAIGETTKSTGSGIFGGQPSSSAGSTTPTTTPAPSKFFSQAPSTTQKGGLFSLPAKSSAGLFGSTTPGSPRIKVEDQASKPLEDIPDAPLPPDSTSKASYPLGESSSSSAYSAAGSPDIRKTPSDAPLPPDSPSAEDAPLPPDPTTNKKLYDVKIPPLPEATTKSKSPPLDDAPLPPDPKTNKKAYDVKFAPLPGMEKPAEKKVGSVFDSLGASTQKSSSIFGGTSKPVQPNSIFGSSAKPLQSTSIFDNKPAQTSGSIFDLGQKNIPKPITTGFLFPTDLPPVTLSSDEEDGEGEVEDGEEDDEHDEEEEEELEEEGESEDGSEGSGVDVAKDFSPPSAGKDKTTPAITPGSSFDGLGGSFSTISKPETERKSLFGELGRSVPSLPQPNPLSPRSPSPVRNAFTSRVTGEQSRSFSAPGMTSQILGASKRPGSRGPPIISKEIPPEDPRIEQRARAKAKRDAEETQLLVDEDDEVRQQQLKAPVEPTLQLDEFIAHTGPLPLADDNIPAQVEAVYRDINAMIDTLGLNARSLGNFITGHADTFCHEHRDKNDLANPDNWTIGELDDLRIIISEDLVNDLSDARIVDVQDKIAECQDLHRDLKRDFSKRNEIQKMINAKVDPNQNMANRSLPLTAEQAARQNDLRRDFARFTKTLAEAEESLMMLKTKIASASAANGKPGSAPTIDALVRTISKMTSMVEKRSGDVDVLENQMRKLRFTTGSPVPGLGGSTRSREGTPTPKKFGSSLIFSPDRSFRESTPTRNSVMRHSMSASVSSIGNGMFAVRTPPRKKLSGFGEFEKKAVIERRDKRAAVLGKLRASVRKKGASVWAVDDIE